MDDDIIGPPLPEIISRKDAMAKGLTRYFTGQPCKRGHIAEKNISRQCAVCKQENARKRQAANPDKGAMQQAAYRAKNPERRAAVQAAWQAANRAKLSAKRAAHRAANPEKSKATATAYYARNREKRREQSVVYRTANAERIKAQKAASHAKSPEKAKAYAAAYRARNPGRWKAVQVRYRINNPDKVKATEAAYRIQNREICRAQLRRYKARKLAAEGNHTAADIQRIYEAQKGKCACCKRTVGKKYHVDHIQPLAKGGSNAARNLQILCPTCNTSKQARDPIEYMQSLGMLL